MDRYSRGSSPTVREGFNQQRNEPSLTVGLLPRFADWDQGAIEKGGGVTFGIFGCALSERRAGRFCFSFFRFDSAAGATGPTAMPDALARGFSDLLWCTAAGLLSVLPEVALAKSTKEAFESIQ